MNNIVSMLVIVGAQKLFQFGMNYMSPFNSLTRPRFSIKISHQNIFHSYQAHFVCLKKLWHKFCDSISGKELKNVFCGILCAPLINGIEFVLNELIMKIYHVPLTVGAHKLFQVSMVIVFVLIIFWFRMLFAQIKFRD